MLDLPILPSLPKKDFNHSYSAKYSDLSSVNLSYVRPGFIEAAPVTVTTLNGKKILLNRRKRLEGYQNSKMEIVNFFDLVIL